MKIGEEHRGIDKFFDGIGVVFSLMIIGTIVYSVKVILMIVSEFF